MSGWPSECNRFNADAALQSSHLPARFFELPFNTLNSTPLEIVEGFFGVMHLWQLGIRRVVALMGLHMSACQEELICKLVRPESKIILALDNDDAGIEARQQIAFRLSQHCFVRGFRWPESLCEPDELSSEHLGLFQG